MRSGDILLEIDGRQVEGGTLEEIIERMRGFVGSTVQLTIERSGEPEPLRFALERSEVHVRTVRAEPLAGRYGYLRVTHFTDATPRDFDRALADLQSMLRRCAGSYSTCAAIPVASSNRRSAWPTSSSTPASSSALRAALPNPVSCCARPRATRCAAPRWSC